MSSSDPCPLKALTHQRMNRQLSGTYPLDGLMRSRDGEKNSPCILPMVNGSPVNSQYPVQRASAHASVSSKGGNCFILVRVLAAPNDFFHGLSTRSAFATRARVRLARSRLSPVHRDLLNSRTYSRCSSRQRAVLATRSARRGACDLSSISFARSGLRWRQSRACQRTLQGLEQNRCVLRPGLNELLHSKQDVVFSMIGLWTKQSVVRNHNLCQEAVA